MLMREKLWVTSGYSEVDPIAGICWLAPEAGWLIAEAMLPEE